MWCLIAMAVTGGVSLPPTDCSFLTEAACHWYAADQNGKYKDPTEAPYLYICGDIQKLKVYKLARQVELVTR